jgi:hypothetical protein
VRDRLFPTLFQGWARVTKYTSYVVNPLAGERVGEGVLVANLFLGLLRFAPPAATPQHFHARCQPYRR